MLHSRIHQCLIIVLTLLLTFSLSAGHAAACKVLIVSKLSEAYGFNQETKKGIEAVLGERCNLIYSYFDAEINPDDVDQKVQETYDLYQELQPDGVLALEEAVNPLFVVPYLKDKVKTPVIFVGMYSPMETYGYPASNVTGVVSRPFGKESLTFLRQIVPTVQTMGFVCNDDSASQSGIPWFQEMYEKMGMKVPASILSNSGSEIVSWVKEHTDELDTLFICPILGEKIVSDVLNTFQKPTFSCWKVAMEYGVLAGVIESGEEMGKYGAEMLLEAMEGAPISDIHVRYPEYGVRVINVNTMKALGIKPSRRVLTGVELIK